MGCMKKLPKKQEMLQMPGRGPLDFRPIVVILHYNSTIESAIWCISAIAGLKKCGLARIGLAWIVTNVII